MRVAQRLLDCSETYGRVYPYEKSYDRITTRTEKPLQLLDRIKYNPTTSDDPVIQEVSVLGAVFMTFGF